MTSPHASEARRKATRNRQLFDERQKGFSFRELARRHCLSVNRVRILIDLEKVRIEREAELMLADSLPIQPNPLHLSPRVRGLLAEAVKRDDFTRYDVVAVGDFSILRLAGMTGQHWREVKAWLERPGPSNR
ncbi:hypothetical protein [Rhizobium sp. TRM95796]|uniref:hypothetical protein n=1 Tax=Rhizobium sp. TRM95796 TaxID=2979862 RepID=UPI0021E91B5D|nr:hypothetical protein [Rhizobium sp. TRM95796]MCV3768675.1 hypothetical protein [Rhizobium sp. TRM95796]